MKAVKLVTIASSDAFNWHLTEEQVADILKKANGRATAHTINTRKGLTELIVDFQNQLDVEGLTLAERSGAEFHHRGAGAWANKYKNTMTVSSIVLRMGSDGRTVFVVEATTANAYPKQAERNEVALRPAGLESWLARKAKRFSVIKPAVAVAA